MTCSHNQRPILQNTTISSFPLFPSDPQCFDLCFAAPELALFIGLATIAILYAWRLRSIAKAWGTFGVSPNALPISGVLPSLNRAVEVGNLVTARRVERLPSFCALLTLVNPVPWGWSRLLYGGPILAVPALVPVKFVILILSVGALRIAAAGMHSEGERAGDVSVVLGYATFALLVLAQTVDFFLLFLTLELTALLFYAALAARRSTREAATTGQTLPTRYAVISVAMGSLYPRSFLSITAAFTYLLLNLAATAAFLLALVFLLAHVGSTNMLVIAQHLGNSPAPLAIPVLLVSAVFLFKLSAAPFHWWIPAVSEGASTSTLILLALPAKVVFLFAFCRILYGVFAPLSTLWQPLLIFAAVASMVVGSVGLFYQTKLKRFRAFSTINHMGYIPLGIGTNSFIGLRATIVYLFGYIPMNLIFLALVSSLTNESFRTRIYSLNQLGLFSPARSGAIPLALSILVFSLIGIPPSLGFWGKYLVLTATITTFTWPLAPLIAVLAVATSVVAAGSYLRVWRSIFSESGNILQAPIIALAPVDPRNVRWLVSCACILAAVNVLIPGLDACYDILDRFIVTLTL